jgi:phosphoribosylamine--glycine ligase
LGDPVALDIAWRLGAQHPDACPACAAGALGRARANFAADHAITVVMAAKGYPGGYRRGEPIGLPEIDDPRVKIFHAGTRMTDGRLVADGGRVLGATARAASLGEARGLAYAALAGVDWPGGFFRRDIGWRALKREEA